MPEALWLCKESFNSQAITAARGAFTLQFRLVRHGTRQPRNLNTPDSVTAYHQKQKKISVYVEELNVMP